MSGEGSEVSPPPAARLFVSYVPALMGFHSKRGTNDVLKELRRQQTTELKPLSNQLVDTETYWTLVGMIKDKFEEPKAFHIDLLKSFIKDEHPESWYEKLYNSIRISITNSEKPKAVECYLGKKKGVVLCGKPDIIEGKTIIDIQKVSKFVDEIDEATRVQMHCYMKLSKLKKGIVRQVCGTETKDNPIVWDSSYWKRIEKLILAFVEFV